MNAIDITARWARRIVTAIVGSTILLIGIVMIAAPGPAILVIPFGLAILGLEFAWARRWLKRLRQGISASASRKRGDRAETHRERHREVKTGE